MAFELVKYEEARAALKAVATIDEVKAIHDKFVAFALYAKQAKDTDMMNWAVEIKVRAERRAGELLKAMTKNTGAKGIGTSAVLKKDHTPTLAKLGISKNDSSLWQKLATMPDSTFEQILAVVKAKGGKLTTKAVLSVKTPESPLGLTKAVSKEPLDDDEAMIVMCGDVFRMLKKLKQHWPGRDVVLKEVVVGMAQNVFSLPTKETHEPQ